MDPIEVLGFLMTLGSLELGCDYSSDELTASQKTMLSEMKHLGLIYQRKVSVSTCLIFHRKRAVDFILLASLHL
jgi:hypothetical protein